MSPGAQRLAKVLILLGATPALASQFMWLGVPSGGGTGLIGATDPSCSVAGDTITCPGGGVYVQFDVYVAGWDDGTGRQLGAHQATVDPNSYDNGIAMLVPRDFANTANRKNGVYQVTRTCLAGGSDGIACGSSIDGPYGPGLPGVAEADCQADGGFFCAASPDFVMTCCDPVATAGCHATMCLSPANCPCSWGASPGPSGGAGAVDQGVPVYLGSFVLEVPAGASGTWEIGFSQIPNLTFMTGHGKLIGIERYLPGYVHIPTGTCCSQQGPVLVCENDFTEADCSGEWNWGAVCSGPVAPEPALCVDCSTCIPGPDPACDDGNACTDDDCCCEVDCQGCRYTPNYDTVLECCDPWIGSIVLIDDGDDCTIDVCDPDEGEVTHFPASDGTSCDDDNPCTINDSCTAGDCGGDLVTNVPCTGDDDCLGIGQGCDLATGLCLCDAAVDLCVNPAPGPFPNVCCFDAGETVHYAIQTGRGVTPVTGGQFLLSYDPSCMDFQQIGPCEGSVFVNQIKVDVDEVSGEIFYAILTEPGEGTLEPADLACLSFVKHDGCDACEICIEDENPRRTLLTSASGNPVPINRCLCSKPIRSPGEIELTVPDSTAVNADCDLPTGTSSWDSAHATDSCDGDLSVNCVADHAEGQGIGHLIDSGGAHPQGTAFYLCEATNTCGAKQRNVWTVDVADDQSLDVTVHLAPDVSGGVFERAITFNLYENCTTAPAEACATVSFNGPYNFPGHGTVNLDVDAGNYSCITAQDCLHTLRSAADIDCIAGRYVAEFKGGAPDGNWLVGGNLDCYKKGVLESDANCVNILDFGMFIAEIAAGASYANGDTHCTTDGPHGDINADGTIDALDYGFLLDNFLDCSKSLCCKESRSSHSPRTEISLLQLRKMGLSDLAVGDLNGDGRLNVDDMVAYMQGVMPLQNVGEKRSSSR